MKEQFHYDENIVYVDTKGNIGNAEQLHIINLNDYSQEAREAFFRVQSGNLEAYEKWAHRYGLREEAYKKRSTVTPEGFITVATPEFEEYIEENILLLKLRGLELVKEEEN